MLREQEAGELVLVDEVDLVFNHDVFHRRNQFLQLHFVLYVRHVVILENKFLDVGFVQRHLVQSVVQGLLFQLHFATLQCGLVGFQAEFEVFEIFEPVKLFH